MWKQSCASNEFEGEDFMNKIGIIQGRLSPRPFPKLQEYPKKTWEQEFYYAKEIGFDYIEWIFEQDEYEKNLLWTAEGRKKIRETIGKTGVSVESVCADYFLENPFYRRSGYSLEEIVQKMNQVIEYTADIGAKVILLPVLENAELRSKEEKKVLMEALNQCINTLERCDVKIGFETELKNEEYYKLAYDFHSPNIGIYYDTGNCAFRGYDMKKDMEVLKDLLICVHVKDRVVGGGSVPLGTGDTNFKEGIPYLLDNGFEGNFTLQTYFEDKHLETAATNIEFMRKLLRK